MAISVELEVTIPSWKDVGAGMGRPLVEALLAVVFTEVLVVVVRDSSSQIPMQCEYSTFGSVPVSSSSDGPYVSILLSLLIHAFHRAGGIGLPWRDTSRESPLDTGL